MTACPRPPHVNERELVRDDPDDPGLGKVNDCSDAVALWGGALMSCSAIVQGLAEDSREMILLREDIRRRTGDMEGGTNIRVQIEDGLCDRFPELAGKVTWTARGDLDAALQFAARGTGNGAGIPGNPKRITDPQSPLRTAQHDPDFEHIVGIRDVTVTDCELMDPLRRAYLRCPIKDLRQYANDERYPRFPAPASTPHSTPDGDSTPHTTTEDPMPELVPLAPGTVVHVPKGTVVSDAAGAAVTQATDDAPKFTAIAQTPDGGRVLIEIQTSHRPPSGIAGVPNAALFIDAAAITAREVAASADCTDAVARARVEGHDDGLDEATRALAAMPRKGGNP